MKPYNFLKHLLKFVTWIDMGGTVLADGNQDCTVSATIGFFKREQPLSKYWERLRVIVDSTFWLVEGTGHCERAYKSDPNEEFEVRFKSVFFIITAFVCLLLIPIFVIVFIFKRLLNGGK